MKLSSLILFVSECAATLTQTCNNVTDLHWNLFKIAFASRNYVRFDVIARKEQLISPYAETILRKSYEHFKSPIFVHKRDPDYDEPNLDHSEQFSWNGEKLPLRKSQAKTKISMHSPERLNELGKDENHFLQFVVVGSINDLDNFLYGPPRKPFTKPRERCVIAIKENYSTNFMQKVTKIFKRLWNDYGIYKVLVISVCQDKYFYQFDPFTSVKTYGNFQNDAFDLKKWGKVEMVDLKNANLLFRWDPEYAFDYNGYPMRTVMFPRVPTAMPWTDLPQPFVQSYFCKARLYSQKFGSVDGIILGNLFERLNFTPFVFLPTSEYGYQLNNGTWVGSIGNIIYSQAGFSSNGRFIQDYGTTEIEFMYPIFFDKFCIIAPKAQQIPQWLAVFRCFNPYVWVLIIVSTIFLGCIWYFFKKWTLYLRTLKYLMKRPDEIVSPIHDQALVAVIDMWLIMTSGAPSLMPYYAVERLYITGCLLLSLIIGGTFQGSLTTSYSTKSYYKDIHTLKELDNSGLLIGTSSRNLANLFESQGNPIFESLQRKFIIRKETTIDQAAFKRDICCIERASDINVIITTKFELADGSPLLHVVEECPRSYHLSFIVRKGWPFLHRFNQILMRMSEGGFLIEWYDKVEEAIILSARMGRLRDLKDTLQAFTLKDMQTAFYLLGIGDLLCIMIFFVELYVGRRQNTRR